MKYQSLIEYISDTTFSINSNYGMQYQSLIEYISDDFFNLPIIRNPMYQSLIEYISDYCNEKCDCDCEYVSISYRVYF